MLQRSQMKTVCDVFVRIVGLGILGLALHFNAWTIYFHDQNKQRMPNLLIIGPTNNGKSMIVEKFRRDHFVSPAAQGGDREYIPVVVVQTPSEPSVARFYSGLLAGIGAPIRRQARVAELEQLALQLLKAVNAENSYHRRAA